MITDENLQKIETSLGEMFMQRNKRFTTAIGGTGIKVIYMASISNVGGIRNLHNILKLATSCNAIVDFVPVELSDGSPAISLEFY